MSTMNHLFDGAPGRFHVVLGMALLRDDLIATAGSPARSSRWSAWYHYRGHCLLEAVAPRTARTA
jgi:hypothetical protein